MTDSEPCFAISHVADAYRRYPGEPLTLYTRVDVLKPAPGFSLRIGLPESLTPRDYEASADHGKGLPEFVVAEAKRYLIWNLDRPVQAGERYEYELRATVAPAEGDLTLSSRAIVGVAQDGHYTEWIDETVNIAIDMQGRYLRYLPAIYAEQDDLMARFLMLFESFWAPIEQQIDSLHLYFDPRMTPAALLGWLAAWVDLALKEQWPEERKRKLIRRAVQLYRKRGTPHGLQEYLEIYTGVMPQIFEHPSNDLRLGPNARLGPGIALGTRNVPHSFTVNLRLPPLTAGTADAQARQEAERRRTIEAIIEAEKPAHTTYTLQIETVSRSPEPMPAVEKG